MNIRAFLVRQGRTGATQRWGVRAGFTQIRADYSGQPPNCNAAGTFHLALDLALTCAACGLPPGSIWVRRQESKDVKKAPKIRLSHRHKGRHPEITEDRDKTSSAACRRWH
jgi:hypothetical protein